MGARQLICCMAVVLLLAGCHKNANDTGAVTGETNGGNVTSAPPGGVVGQNGAAQPGTEADLVQNVGDRVFFGYNEYDLTAQAKATIEHQAQWLKTYPSVNVMVEGHCDERGTREYNLALGEKRAMAVRNYLVANGVEAGRVQTISYGKERPAVLGSDETSWAQNRRGVVVVQ
jgi:peptidoglycan-associated lipoprotein